MSICKISGIFVLCACLAACGDTLAEQGLSGAAIGASAAALTNGSLVQGAAIGAAGTVAFCQINPDKCN